MRFCPHCGRMVPAGIRFCPFCGGPLVSERPPAPKKKGKMKILIPVIAGAVVVAAALLVLFLVILPNHSTGGMVFYSVDAILSDADSYYDDSTDTTYYSYRMEDGELVAYYDYINGDNDDEDNGLRYYYSKNGDLLRMVNMNDGEVLQTTTYRNNWPVETLDHANQAVIQRDFDQKGRNTDLTLEGEPYYQGKLSYHYDYDKQGKITKVTISGKRKRDSSDGKEFEVKLTLPIQYEKNNTGEETVYAGTIDTAKASCTGDIEEEYSTIYQYYTDFLNTDSYYNDYIIFYEMLEDGTLRLKSDMGNRTPEFIGEFHMTPSAFYQNGQVKAYASAPFFHDEYYCDEKGNQTNFYMLSESGDPVLEFRFEYIPVREALQQAE